MPAIAPPLAIAPEDLHTLGQWSRSSGIRAALAERAKILLLAAEGLSNTEIARQVGCTRPTVILWRHRYTQAGLDGLGDQPRSGRPQTVRRDRRAEILAATLRPPPHELGVTHWSTRLLAAELGCSHSTIARVWADHHVKPWQIQALERTHPVRAVKPGRPERHTHDYIRHGTATLFAALEIATGQVTDQLTTRHRHSEFLAFLKQVAGAYPRRQLHVVCDNYATHKHVKVRAWLAAHPRFHVHFTPTYSSWLNLVSVNRGVLLHRGASGTAPWRLCQRHRPHRRHQSLLYRLEPALPTVLLDQVSRRDPQQARLSNYLSDAALGGVEARSTRPVPAPPGRHCHRPGRARDRVPQPAGVHRYDHAGRQACLPCIRRPGRVRTRPCPRAHQGWAGRRSRPRPPRRPAVGADRQQAAGGPRALRVRAVHRRRDRQDPWREPRLDLPPPQQDRQSTGSPGR